MCVYCCSLSFFASPGESNGVDVVLLMSGSCFLPIATYRPGTYLFELTPFVICVDVQAEVATPTTIHYFLKCA